MGELDIKIEDISDDQEMLSEGCLICCNQCDQSFQTCRLIDILKTLLGRDKSCSGNDCTSAHLLSIFILRKLLNYPKTECEELLRRMTGVNPGEWFRLCHDCSQVVEKVLESLHQIIELEQKISELKKFAGDKLKESLLWESELSSEPVATISARNIIRHHFKKAHCFAQQPNQQSFTVEGSRIEGMFLTSICNGSDSNPFVTRYSTHLNPLKRARSKSKQEELVFANVEVKPSTPLDNVSDNITDVGADDIIGETEFSSQDYLQNCDDVAHKGEINLTSKRRCGMPPIPTEKTPVVQAKSPTTTENESGNDSDQLYIPEKVEDYEDSSSHEDLESDKDRTYKDINSMKRVRRRPGPKSKPPISSITCDICGKTPSNEDALRRHMSHYHKEIHEQRLLEKKNAPKLKCPLCSKIFWRKFYLKNHVEAGKCLKDTNTSKKRLSNAAADPTSNANPSQSNSQTDTTTKTVENEHMHARQNHKTKSGLKQRKPSLDDRIGRLLLRNVVTSNSDAEFKCNFCDKTHPTLSRASNHARKNHRKELGFKPKFPLSNPTSKPYKCSQCKYSFAKRFKLKKHVKSVHEKVRDVFCDKCGAAFSDRTNLFAHIASFHSEEKLVPEICDICGKSAINKKALRTHKHRYHEPDSPMYRKNEKIKGPARCTHCGAEFAHRKLLSNHIASAHNELYIHQCLSCPQKFIKICGLLSHEKKNHSIN